MDITHEEVSPSLVADVRQTFDRNASINIDANAAPADASILTDAPVNRNANPPESGQFKTVSRNGVAYKMNTDNIGRRRRAQPAPAPMPGYERELKFNAAGLLPCPFCGSANTTPAHNTGDGAHVAICPDDDGYQPAEKDRIAVAGKESRERQWSKSAIFALFD